MEVRFGGISSFTQRVHLEPLHRQMQHVVNAPQRIDTQSADAFVRLHRQAGKQISSEHAMQAQQQVFDYRADKFSIEAAHQFMSTPLL